MMDVVEKNGDTIDFGKLGKRVGMRSSSGFSFEGKRSKGSR